MASHIKNHRSKNSAVHRPSAKELVSKNRININKGTSVLKAFFYYYFIKSSKNITGPEHI